MSEPREIQADDLVILSEGFSKDRRSVAKVVRTTATRIIIAGSPHPRSFMRRGGREVGYSGYGGANIYRGDADAIARVREEQHRRALILRIRNMDGSWSKATTAQLEAVVAALPPEAPR